MPKYSSKRNKVRPIRNAEKKKKEIPTNKWKQNKIMNSH